MYAMFVPLASTFEYLIIFILMGDVPVALHATLSCGNACTIVAGNITLGGTIEKTVNINDNDNHNNNSNNKTWTK